MKQLLLSAFAFLFFLADNQAQTYQDTTFTDPVFVIFPDDFVTFKNCHFVGIDGDAIYLEGAGVLISNCTFDNISGSAVVAYTSEVYLVEDTMRHLVGGVQGFSSAMVAIGCQMSDIALEAFKYDECVVAEIRDCQINRAETGAFIYGSADFEEVYIVNTSIQNVSANALGVYEVNQLTIEGVTIDSCLGTGIDLWDVGDVSLISETVKLQDNHISHTNLWGVYASNVNNAVFRNNDISYPGFLNGFPDESEGCIYWKGQNIRIEGNHLHHALDSGCENADCQGVGLWLASPATVTKNHIHDCAGHGIFYQNSVHDSPNALQVFNNIIYDVAGNAIAYDGVNALLPEPVSSLIRNNTLHTTLNAPLSVRNNLIPIATEGNILVFEGEADTSKFVHLSPLGIVLDNLNLKTSGDAGFVDFAGRDFHLASETSLAYNFLPLNFGLPNDDFDGELRLGLRDAGADELTSDEIICGCNNCPNEIPDLYFGDFTFAVISADKNNLAASDQGVCGVRVEFEHEYIGDVTMQLISPAGQIVQLVGPSGFWGSTLSTNWNVGFVACGLPASPDPGFPDVWNNSLAWGESANYTGTYYPSVGCLDDLNTGTVTGDWTLRVFDNQADDQGTVKGFEVMFCDMSGVSCFVCTDAPTAAFSSNPASPWGVFFNNQTSGSVSNYSIDYGDGLTASGPTFPAFHLYENAGQYLVRLIATNDCGVDTFFQTVQVAGALPVAFAYGEPSTGCAPLEVQTVVVNSDHVDTWHWFFPGGTPAESFEEAPTVVYTLPGDYEVSLILTNEVGNTTINQIFSVSAQQDVSNPSFTAQVLGDSIICTNTSQNATSFHWTLDGGSPEGANTSPFVFEVDASGNYSVGLTVAGLCDTFVLVEVVPVIISNTQNLEREGWQFGLFPNPNDGRFYLEIKAKETLPTQLSIVNALGVQVFVQQLDVTVGDNQFAVAVSDLPAGVYEAQIQTATGRANLRFVVR